MSPSPVRNVVESGVEGPYRGLSQIPAEVWLDADGLARRIAVITPPAPGEVVSPREAYSQAGESGPAPA